jgi:HD domain
VIDLAGSGWPPHLALPESAIVSLALDLCADVSPRFLSNHAVRTYGWGCLLAEVDGVEFDRELLCVASLLHDLGLTETFKGPRCFELESAAAAVAFVRERGWDLARSADLGEAIRLHMQSRVVRDDGPEAYLLSEATACDVTGSRYEDLAPELRVRVLSVADREGFRQGFTQLFRQEAGQKPGCMADLYLRQGLAERIASAPFPE